MVEPTTIPCVLSNGEGAASASPLGTPLGLFVAQPGAQPPFCWQRTQPPCASGRFRVARRSRGPFPRGRGRPGRSSRRCPTPPTWLGPTRSPVWGTARALIRRCWTGWGEASAEGMALGIEVRFRHPPMLPLDFPPPSSPAIRTPRFLPRIYPPVLGPDFPSPTGPPRFYPLPMPSIFSPTPPLPLPWIPGPSGAGSESCARCPRNDRGRLAAFRRRTRRTSSPILRGSTCRAVHREHPGKPSLCSP
jgi:hypothetical protein